MYILIKNINFAVLLTKDRDMEEFGLINATKLPQLMVKLTSSECKILLFILYYLSSKNKRVYVNNAESREFLSSMGLKRTPVRISGILSSLTQKGILQKEYRGVYSVAEDLYLPAGIVGGSGRP